MIKIWNKTQRKLVVELADEKFIHLWPRSTKEISERDLKSPHLTGFMSRGEVRLLEEKKKPLKPKKKKMKRSGKISDEEKAIGVKAEIKEVKEIIGAKSVKKEAVEEVKEVSKKSNKKQRGKNK